MMFKMRVDEMQMLRIDEPWKAINILIVMI